MASHALKVRSKSAPQTNDSTAPAKRSKAVRNILRAGVQPKLKIGAVNDPAEYEADRVADQVMRMPAPLVADAQPAAPLPLGDGIAGGHGGTPPPIRRQCSACDDEKIQRKPIMHTPPVIRRHSNGHDSSGGPANPQASAAINSLGSGSPLPSSERSFFEPRFGRDLSGVRIHTGGTADMVSKAINARAFTLGNNIAFASGQYQPGTHSGRTLMAHELTHTLQQKGVAGSMVQRDFAIVPTHPDAEVQTLTARQIRRAIRWNQGAFSDADEIGLLRDVLGRSPEPAVIDEDFVNALVWYQARYGLTQDGLLGAGTALQLANELRGEASRPGVDGDVGTAPRMALNPAERRMRLRSRVASRLGRMLHQGFIGPTDNPTGAVTVRSGFTNPTRATSTNSIGINYTGANVANSRWVQFAFRQMSAVDPDTNNRTYRTGSVTTSGGTNRPYSTGSTFNWTVDAAPSGGSMYYEVAGTDERTAGHTEIFDQPRGWHGQASAFAATFATRPNRVRMINGFDSYLVVDHNSVVYHVRWNVMYNFDTSVSPTTDVPGSYEVLNAGAARRLPTSRKAALDAAYPSNTVP